MSSPYRLSVDRARSSPSRHRLNGHHTSHRNSHHESQSSQLVDELSRLLVDDDRSFKKKLDEESQLQQKRHVEALEKALAQHEAVRKSAEHTYETIQLEAERQRLAREIEQKRKLEDERRRLAEAQEAERRRLEAERKEAEERKQRAEELEREQKAKAERDAAEKKQQEDEARAREQAAKDRAAAEQRAKDEAAANQAQQTQQQQQQVQNESQIASSEQDVAAAVATAQQTAPASSQAVGSTREDRVKAHNAYLQIHARCKVLRKEIDSLKSSDRGLYDTIKDNARQVKQNVGQLTKGDKKGNQEKAKKVIEIWAWSATCAPNITADINDFRTEPVQSIQVPKVFLYIVNITSKVIIKQMSTECGARSDPAEPLGILAAVIFANAGCKPQGHPMSDMLLAKFHKVHPCLFGLTFNELTGDGRARLGFREEYGDKEGWFRAVRGMSRGYAALTLRDFSRSQSGNPFPNRLFWESLARVSMTPQAEQVQITFVTLEGLLDPLFVPRFIHLFGDMALAALRHATIDFPKTRHPTNASHGALAKHLEEMHLQYEGPLHLRL